MASIAHEQDPFKDLPRFDAKDFQAPAWAFGPQFQWGREQDAESSRAASESGAVAGGDRSIDHDGDETFVDAEGSETTDVEEAFEDASEGYTAVDITTGEFTTAELRRLLAKAVELKDKGNRHFTAKPPEIDQAVEAYKSSLECLPAVPKENKEKPREGKNGEKAVGGSSGIEEVTDEEAVAIEEKQARQPDVAEVERGQAEEAVRDCTKACWGNLAACHLSKKKDTEAVEACTKALAIDPNYVKVLQRRSATNDRLSTWSSLTAAQEDYKLLLRLLPPSSPQLVSTRHALNGLPARIQDQQVKEKDEMLGKLKELGNGLLGKFGLNTDMFKFDEQPGGGYSMRFER